MLSPEDAIKRAIAYNTAALGLIEHVRGSTELRNDEQYDKVIKHLLTEARRYHMLSRKRAKKM